MLKRIALDIMCNDLAMPTPRSYTDDHLRAAIEAAQSWADVLRALGKPPNYPATWPRRHAAQAGIDVTHLEAHHMTPVPAVVSPFANPVQRNGGRSGLSIACRWFLDRGYNTSIPLEPADYDLIAESNRGLIKVQVKTTCSTEGNGRFHVKLTRKVYDATKTPNAIGKRRQAPYTSEQIDYFFIHTSMDEVYLIPIGVTGARSTIVLDMRYEAFKV
jgi:hypothetical protein